MLLSTRQYRLHTEPIALLVSLATLLLCPTFSFSEYRNENRELTGKVEEATTLSWNLGSM